MQRVRLTPRATWLLTAAVLLICAAFAWWGLAPAVRRANGEYLAFSDFFAQWTFARFPGPHAAAQIYDAEALHQFQLTYEPALRQTFPFPYPPHYLFAVWPLRWLPYGVAYLAWDVVTLLLFLWAVCGDRIRPLTLAFLVLAPVTVIDLFQGQNGLLTSALLVGGLRLMRGRPVLGGILLGCATIKPQLGVLIPLALIAAGSWRTLAAAAATTVALILLSSFAFGWGIWPAWLEAAAGHAGYVDQSVSDYLKPGIMATLALARVTVPVAHAVQLVVSVTVAAIVAICFRRGATDLSVAALQVGTFLAMPYAFRYDMPMTVNAILLLVCSYRRGKERIGPIDAAIIAGGILAPALTTATTRFFYVSAIALVLLFGLIVWRRLRAEQDQRRAA